MLGRQGRPEQLGVEPRQKCIGVKNELTPDPRPAIPTQSAAYIDVVKYKFSQDVDKEPDAGIPLLGRHLLARQPGLVRELASHNRFDAMLRHLLLTEGTPASDVALVSDEDIRRYIARMQDLSQGANLRDLLLAFEFGFAGSAPSAGGVLMPVASGLLLPRFARRPNDRQIIIRSAASQPAPPNFVPKTLLKSPSKDAVDDFAQGVALDAPEAKSDADETLIDLSAALTACMADDRLAQHRMQPGRRRWFGKMTPWAVAAALAFAIVPAEVHWPSPPPKKANVGASALPAEHLPAPAIRVASQVEAATRTKVASLASAVPPAPAPKLSSASAAPQEGPLKTAMVPAAAVPAAKHEDRRPEAATHDEVSTDEASARVVVPGPKGAPPANLLLATETSPQKVAAGRAAKRKTRKVTYGKQTNVASVLALPDVLKPQ